MELVVNRKDLLGLLTVGASRSGLSKALPVLDNVLLEMKDNGFLYATSCDGECSVTSKVQVVSSDVSFSYLVDPKVLSKIASSIPDENVKLDFTNSTNCVIEHENGRFEIALAETTDFPILENALKGNSFKVDAQTLGDIVSCAKNFVSDDSLRPIMMGVWFKASDGVMQIAGTDGHKLFTDKINVDTNNVVEFVLSSSACSTLLHLCTNSDEITIYENERTVTFRTSDTLYSCKKLEGKYPNVNAVIPNNYPIKVNVTKGAITSSVKRAMITSNVTSNLLCLDIKGNEMNIESRDIDFSRASHEKLACLLRGDDIKIGVKGSYLSTLLNLVKCEDVEFEMQEPSRAIIIKDHNCPKRIMLLMPLMLD